MSVPRVVLSALALGTLLAAPVAAQGLGDTAAREKAKRTSKGKKEPKVFTNDDLEAGRPPGWKKDESAAAASAPGAASAASPDAPAPPAPVEDDRLAQERPYLDAIRQADSEVSRVQGVIKELQDKLNPMSTSYVYGAGGSNDANEELRVREQLREMERELAAAREQAAAAHKNLQDFRQGRISQSPE